MKSRQTPTTGGLVGVAIRAVFAWVFLEGRLRWCRSCAAWSHENLAQRWDGLRPVRLVVYVFHVIRFQLLCFVGMCRFECRYRLLKLLILRNRVRMLVFQGTYLVRVFILEFRYGLWIIKKVLCGEYRDHDAEARPDNRSDCGLSSKGHYAERAERSNESERDENRDRRVDEDDLGVSHVFKANVKGRATTGAEEKL